MLLNNPPPPSPLLQTKIIDSSYILVFFNKET